MAGTAADAPVPEQLVSEIFVQDLQRSLPFYVSLGFVLIRQEPDFAELRWDEGGLGRAILFLEVIPNQPPPPPSLVANIRVLVPNVDHYYDKCKRLGHRLLKDIDDRYYGLRDFTIYGPDGIGIRFATLLSEDTH